MPHDLDWFDGRLGEAWAGDVPNGSHINLAIGRRGTPTAAAIVGQAGMTTLGHLPIYVCLGSGNLVRPVTVFRNKVTIDDLNSPFALMTWGAAQLGCGQGVLDAVADGLLPAESIDELILLAAVWVDPAATDETAVRLANREAMRSVIADAVADTHTGELARMQSIRETARNAFYSGD
ncbi:MAG: 5,6,7,8-tetrahydromethanopterin hydro-lyase [Gaiellales bacterium]|nr:5,6,7,8-tetrahydromethanopterin hydro-lyase [Gaiellales bacterium]